jgi:hypothetical protein
MIIAKGEGVRVTGIHGLTLDVEAQGNQPRPREASAIEQ